MYRIPSPGSTPARRPLNPLRSPPSLGADLATLDNFAIISGAEPHVRLDFLLNEATSGDQRIIPKKLFSSADRRSEMVRFALYLGLIRSEDFGHAVKAVKINWDTAVGRQVVVEVRTGEFTYLNAEKKPRTKTWYAVTYKGIWPIGHSEALFAYEAADEIPVTTKDEMIRAKRRPRTVPVNAALIPHSLRSLRQWVCWRWVWTVNKQGKGKWSKLLIIPRVSRASRASATDPDASALSPRNPASSIDPDSWGTCDEALEHFTRFGLDGIGFVFREGGGIFGLDIDHCRDVRTGKVTPRAVQIMKSFGTYAEISPSGTGVKLIGFGKLPGDGLKKDDLEVYDQGRYFCVTGQLADISFPELSECQPALDALLRDHFPEAGKPRKKRGRLRRRKIGGGEKGGKTSISSGKPSRVAAGPRTKTSGTIRASETHSCPRCGRTKSCNWDESGPFWKRRLYCVGPDHADANGWRFKGMNRRNPEFGNYECDFRIVCSDSDDPLEMTIILPEIPSAADFTESAVPLEKPDFEAILRAAHELARANPDAMLRFARYRGVSVEAHDALGTGYGRLEDGREVWLFPEKDAEGNIVGIKYIDGTGNKWMVTGSGTGVYYTANWRDNSGPILIPEGVGDAAAAVTMDLAVLARSSARVGVDDIACLLHHLPADRPIVVLGERDQRVEDGNTVWPGRDAAIEYAEDLANLLEREVRWGFVPLGAKDLRDAYKKANPSDDPARRVECGRRLVEEILAKAEVVSPAPPDEHVAEEPADGAEEMTTVLSRQETNANQTSAVAMADLCREPSAKPASAEEPATPEPAPAAVFGSSVDEPADGAEAEGDPWAWLDEFQDNLKAERLAAESRRASKPTEELGVPAVASDGEAASACTSTDISLSECGAEEGDEGSCPRFSHIEVLDSESIRVEKAKRRSGTDSDDSPMFFRVRRPCPWRKMQHLRRKADRNEEAALHLTCKRWCCPACSERKKQGLADALGGALARLKEKHVYVWRGPSDPKVWETVRKAIQRAKGKYFSVEHGSERMHRFVLTTVPVKDAVPVAVADALGLAVAAMRDLPTTSGKPVSYSRGWLTLHAKTYEWDSLGRVAATPDELAPRLEEERVRDGRFTYRMWSSTIHIPWGASFRFPEEMPRATREVVRARLFGVPLSIVIDDDGDIRVIRFTESGVWLDDDDPLMMELDLTDVPLEFA